MCNMCLLLSGVGLCCLLSHSELSRKGKPHTYNCTLFSDSSGHTHDTHTVDSPVDVVPGGFGRVKAPRPRPGTLDERDLMLEPDLVCKGKKHFFILRKCTKAAPFFSKYGFFAMHRFALLTEYLSVSSSPAPVL